jgi:hypothetical protein
MNNKFIPALLLIIIVALACTLMLFQTDLNKTQNEANDLEKELVALENSTSTNQKAVDGLKNQLFTLQNPVYNVTIENITSTGWGVLGGVTVDNSFQITLKNTGVKDVGGLTFKFNILNNDTVWESQDYSVSLISPMQLGVLHVQESTVVTAQILSHVGVSFEGKIFQVTVLYDETVLDECTVILDKGYS